MARVELVDADLAPDGLDPEHVLNDPSVSPKLRRFFDSVKASFVPGYQPRTAVTLEHSAPPAAVAGRRVELAAVIGEGRREVASVLLRWRRSGLLSYETLTMSRRKQSLVASFVLPADNAAYQLEYYLEARDRAGQLLTRVGSPEKPLTVAVSGAPARSDPVYKKWWFWTLLGAAVVGGTTAAVVVLSADKAPEGNLQPGIVRLR